jgi:hypothetical protein
VACVVEFYGYDGIGSGEAHADNLSGRENENRGSAESTLGESAQEWHKPNVVSMPKKKTISAAARRKIAAAQRARWARVKAAQKKTA